MIVKTIFAALGAGLLHVLLGPDHLAAIMTVSACQGNAALWYGIRWGIGHSIGLFIIALIMWVVDFDRSHMQPRVLAITSYFSGAFMIVFGLYFLRQVPWSPRLKLEPAKKRDTVETELHVTNGSDDDTEIGEYAQDELVRLTPTPADMKALSPFDEARSFEYSPCATSARQAVASLFAGLAGGLAGPGGVLAIVPASYCSTKLEAVLYILLFILSSTVAMGLCGLAYGRVTANWVQTSLDRSRQEIRLRVVSSVLCITVGIALVFLTAFNVISPD